MKRIIEIEIGCCGDCPYYNWKKHKCGKGAKDDSDARAHFYADCPIPWHDKAGEQNG